MKNPIKTLSIRTTGFIIFLMTVFLPVEVKAESSTASLGVPTFTIENLGRVGHGDFVVGYRFALESGGRITALGWVDQNGDGKLNGTKPVKVAVWDSEGKELARVEIPLSAEASNGVFYAEIEPLALETGKYMIGALTTKAGEGFCYDATVKALPGVVWEGGLFDSTMELAIPRNSRSQASCYFGPMFKFAISRVAATTPSKELDALQLDYPDERTVFQRNGENRGRLPVRCTIRADIVELRAMNRQTQAFVTEWIGMKADPGKDSFQSPLELPAGWYRLEFRAQRSGNVVVTGTVERTGIGEVFVTCGQSNSANHGGPPQKAQDDRVSSCDFQNGTWVHGDDPQPGASGRGGSAWALLGDLLVKKYDVPVGFISVGVGSTRVSDWSPTGKHYQRLRKALQLAGAHGCRSILWHQGESDSMVGTSSESYAKMLSDIIAQSRMDASWDVPWGIALASFHPSPQSTAERQAAVVAGQQNVIATVLGVFQGPATDSYHTLGFLVDTVHFNAKGLAAHAEGWANSLEKYSVLQIGH